MAVKIRLQRHGKKDAAFFHIVVADGRAPRDGKYIEKLGVYNPNTNPATINLDFDSALSWMLNGAQPTDTCRAILSYKGVMMRHHLHRGVAKGALTQEQADAKLAKWMEEKEAKVESKKTGLTDSALNVVKKRALGEKAANEARIAKIAAKNAPPVVEEPVVEAVVEAPAETPADDASNA